MALYFFLKVFGINKNLASTRKKLAEDRAAMKLRQAIPKKRIASEEILREPVLAQEKKIPLHVDATVQKGLCLLLYYLYILLVVLHHP